MHFSKRFLRVTLFLILKTLVKCTFREEITNNNSSEYNVFRDNVADPFINPDAESLVKIVINNKIEELKPFLQDNDVITMETENNLTLEGKDETTIIEFIPKKEHINKKGLREKSKPLKDNVNKYKKVRDKIQRALDREAISDKTQLLVMKTLDQLIAKLIGSQCSWKSGYENDTKSTILRTSHVINQMWFRQWKNLRENYVNKFKPTTNPQQFEETISFLDKLQTFFSLITKDVDSLADQYNIKCVYVDKPTYRKHQNLVYDSETDLNRHNCQQFAICSNELKSFMFEFYNFLNETVVSVVRNYAEMYLRDTDNDLEKQSIVNAINGSCGIVGKNIIDIFVKQTQSVQLDENKMKEANIKALSKYVKSTIAEVRNNVKTTINNELKTVSERKATPIEADINVNLKVDLDNLERDVLGRICLIFRFCNGKYRGRRSGYLIDINKENDIYVKVQLKLDDEIKNSLKLRNSRRINHKNNLREIISTRKKFDKNYTIFNVTRTTPFFDSIIIKDD
ncbi:uncharacterized protein LOC123697923 [Colias croceus]|uniref:uncharacterized protein LOC123697923 n=1 Tax=Colias crocea TaxID=72248 RepID=UPI001E27D266|nr:uncharacterized protein LOC123697923 [Colias croceus]